MAKACRKCGRVLAVEGFYANARTLDRLSSWCRDCTNRKAASAAKSDVGRERLNAYWRAYHAARRVMYSRACGRCGFVFTTSLARQVYCSSECQVARRSQLRAGPNRAGRLRIMERDGWRCYLCGFDVDPALVWPDDLAGTIDHVVPVARGGPSRSSNLKLAHWACNREKADADAPWWIAV